MADIIISRSEALARRLTNYFTGKPCKYGHIAKRPVSNGTCSACQLEKARAYREQNLDSVRATDARWRSENKAEIAERKSKYYQVNRVQILAQCKRYVEANREKVSARRKLYRQANPEAIKESRAKHYQANREAQQAKSAQYALTNKQRLAAYKAVWKSVNKPGLRDRARHRYAVDPAFRIERALRRLVHRTLKAASAKKDGRTFDILGYAAKDLAIHIERQFVRGMSWDNYGQWHIDHIVPISAMIAQGETNPAVVNALSNLRPLWAYDNLSKGSTRVSLL